MTLNLTYSEAFPRRLYHAPATPAERLREIAIEAVRKAAAQHRSNETRRALIERDIDAALFDQPSLERALTAKYRGAALRELIFAAQAELGKAAHPAPAKVRRGSSIGGMKAAGDVARLSLLDTFQVNGQPIGKVTAQEAKAWAGSRRRDARFVELLTMNLPDAALIGAFRTGDEAAKLYALAEKEKADA